MNKRSKDRDEHRSMLAMEVAGYVCIAGGRRLSPFDVVAIGSIDIVLIRVTRDDWPADVEMESLKLFPTPLLVRKLIHCWHGAERMPRVREL